MLNETTAYVLLVIFAATLIRSTLGFGKALVAVPLLALRIPVTTAAPLAVLVSVLVAAIIVAQDWRKIEVRSGVADHFFIFRHSARLVDADACE